VIRIEGLTKHYGSTVALDALDLEVRTGEVFGFLGPNGAGKTTTIRLLLGLLQPTSGGATVLGLDPWRDVVALHRRLAYVPGDFSTWPQLTGTETFELMARLHGSVDEGYRDALVKRFDLDVSKRGRQYSKGNRQKLALIAALATRAELLVLDEPTSGLDPLMEVLFRECVAEAKEHGQTVFLSSHILSEVEAVCDRVGILRTGKLVDSGSLDDLRHLSAVTLEIEYRGPAPDLRGIDGLEVVAQSEGRLHCRLQGSPDPVIKALATSEVTGLVMREPSLEELFLRYYRADG
jgi:polyether ionophore transport system ATP-binding protein